MTIEELLPSITPLSQDEKLRLIQVVLNQMRRESPDESQRPHINITPAVSFNPLKNSVLFEQDIVSPIGDDWNAAQ